MTNNKNLLDRAKRLYDLGANVVPVKADKNPLCKWSALQSERQSESDLATLNWRSAAAVGVINGVNDWRSIDIDARQDATGAKLAVSETVLQDWLTALGLPPGYPWAWRSMSGTGWHIHVRCTDGTITRVTYNPQDAEACRQVELHWTKCMTAIPAHADIPDTPPAEIEWTTLQRAVDALCIVPEPAPAPAPVTPLSVARNGGPVSLHRLERYAAGALADMADKVRSAPAGTRNDTLNYEAFGAGGLVAGGVLDEDDVRRVLTDAAIQAGLDRNGIAKTIESGLQAGRQSPRSIPDRPPPRGGRGRIARNRGDDDGADDIRWTTLIRAADLANLPPIDWIVPRVIGRGMMTQLFGQPGVGKSLIALDIALTVAQAAAVVYVAGEAIGELKSRIDAWCDIRRCTPGHLYVRTEPVDLRDQDAIDALADEARGVNAALIVIDPLAECMGLAGLDENVAGDMGIAVAALRRLAAGAGEAALLIVHHAGWNDGHERGSSALRAACRVVLRAAADDDGTIRLSCEKANNGAPFEERRFGLVQRGDSVVVLPRSKVFGVPALTGNQLRVLEALDLQQHRDGATFTDILDATSLSKSSVKKAISSLLHRGAITQNGRLHMLAEDGRKALEAVREHDMLASETAAAAGDDFNWTTCITQEAPQEAPQEAAYVPEVAEPEPEPEQETADLESPNLDLEPLPLPADLEPLHAEPEPPAPPPEPEAPELESVPNRITAPQTAAATAVAWWQANRRRDVYDLVQCTAAGDDAADGDHVKLVLRRSRSLEMPPTRGITPRALVAEALHHIAATERRVNAARHIGRRVIWVDELLKEHGG